MTRGPKVFRSDGGTGDAMLLQAAYYVLTVAGNTYGWRDVVVDQEHEALGLLPARIAAHRSFYPEGSPGDLAKRVVPIARARREPH